MTTGVTRGHGRPTGIAPTTLVRAAVLTMVITMSGSALGLVRDLLLARYFGANGGTDAFLVSWTVPETAFPLLVEGAMSFLMVPLFSRALSGSGSGSGSGGGGGAGGGGGGGGGSAGREAVREAVAATLPRTVVALVALAAAVALAAPLLVPLIAPGLADPDLAVTCTRLTAVTVLTFGLAGYLSAALRAHHVFGPPASIHLAYNVGILALIATLHGRLGVVSAAAGVALGSVFMVATQLPFFLRRVGLPRRPRLRGSTFVLAAFVPIAAYTLARQAQVLIERFLGSSLPPGTISHLNYAQKVAQVPMLIALLICTVTFPALARSVAAGRADEARHRLESDLRTVIALIFLAAAYLVALAPVIIEVLLQHGRFSAADTAATASILRVYALGLLGHALVGVLTRPFFTGGHPEPAGAHAATEGERAATEGEHAASARLAGTWYPALVMLVGLAVTLVLAVAGVPRFGVYAIAGANGAGITITAVLLLIGLRRRALAVSLTDVGLAVVRLGAVAVLAGAAGWLAGQAMRGLPALVVGAGGGLVVLIVFAVAGRLAGIAEIRTMWRVHHGR